jgi:MerR family copper efflux transcriptional regulator
MRISEAARAAGLTAKQVRFYDDRGVIRRPARARNGYRDFSPHEVDRLVLVRRLRELDLPLDEVREIAAFCFDGRCDLMNARLREVLLARRTEVDRRRAELDELAANFDTLLARLDAAQLAARDV